MKKLTMVSLILVIAILLCSLCSVLSIAATSETDVVSDSEQVQLMGDVDGNGDINIFDATTIQCIIAQLIVPTDDMLVRAKVCGNEEVSIFDATLIQLYIAKLPCDGFINVPVETPTEKLTEKPTEESTVIPTQDITEKPTEKPTEEPTVKPTEMPTEKPSETVKHTVVFMDYDNTVLSSQDVPEGGTASLPDSPTKSGQTFLGWSGNYANINKDETVKAVYSDQSNVFIIESTSVAEDDTVTVLVSIDGVVKTCGFDFTILYDCGLELVSFDSDLDLDIVANEKAVENGIVLNFSSASDKTKQRDIIELTFKLKDAGKTDFPVTINVKSVKEVSGSNIINADYVVVNGLVKKK